MAKTTFNRSGGGIGGGGPPVQKGFIRPTPIHSVGGNSCARDPELTMMEKQYLLACERGDLASVKHYLNLSKQNQNFNINCVDPLGNSALLIAIENENIEMIETLLEADVETGDAILYAINEENVEAVEIILNHLERHEKFSTENQATITEHSAFTPDITPIILAAHRDNYEIIKLLLDRGASIPHPHDVRCDCKYCIRASAEDSLRLSRSRINAYRALASPSLVCLSARDPILYAFELSWEELSQKCQKFSTDLLDQTRGSKELEIILNHDTSDRWPIRDRAPGERMQLTRLKLAVQFRQKRFVSHANCQQLLASIWYEGLPGFRRRNIAFKVLLILTVFLSFPLLAMCYLVVPKTSLGRFIRKPFIKFLCHSASYVFFLVLLILASQRIDYDKFFSGSEASTTANSAGSEGSIGAWARNLNCAAARYMVHNSSLSSFIANQRRRNRSAAVEGGASTGLKKALANDGSSSSDLKPAAADSSSTSSDASQRESHPRKELRGPPPSPVEWAIVVYVAGLVWVEVKQLWDMGLYEYCHNMWNILDFITNNLYLIAIALRVIAYIQVEKEIQDEELCFIGRNLARKHWDARDPTLISECVFATANIFSSLKLVHIFTVNPHLGPLQISLGRMIIDILKFFFVYCLVLFAFACGLNQLFWYYATMRRAECNASMNSSSLSSTAEIMEKDKSSCAIRNSAFANLFNTVETLFWSIFGLIDLDRLDLKEEHVVTEWAGKTMFGTYGVISIVVLLNMLIAMMSNSYQYISDQADVEWKFARSKLWIEYFEEGATLPAPFNIIPSPKSVYYAFNWFCDKFCKCSRRITQTKQRSLRFVMRNLVKRYIAHIQRMKQQAEGVSEDDVNEIKQDISAFRFELLDILKKSGMDTGHSNISQKASSRSKRSAQAERRLMIGFQMNVDTIPEVDRFLPKLPDLPARDDRGNSGGTIGSSVSPAITAAPDLASIINVPKTLHSTLVIPSA